MHNIWWLAKTFSAVSTGQTGDISHSSGKTVLLCPDLRNEAILIDAYPVKTEAELFLTRHCRVSDSQLRMGS